MSCVLCDVCLHHHQLAVLPLGAVHNNRLCSSLVNYLRTPSVPFKAHVTPVLTQIMSNPHLFSMSDPPRLDTILLGLKEVCMDWRSNAERRGQVFLPKPFQVRARCAYAHEHLSVAVCGGGGCV